MLVPNRHGSSTAYRYGYQGSEKDDEIKGEGNSYYTHHRLLDPRVGRWMSVDPEWDEYPDESPYTAMENNPVSENDPDGDCPWCIAGLKGLVQEYGTQVISNFAEGKGWKQAFTDVDGGEILQAGLEDAVTLGAAGFYKKAKTVVKIVKAADKANDAKKTVQRTVKVKEITSKVAKVQKNAIKAEQKATKTVKKATPKGACFIKGTLILTSKGLKSIERIVVGDTVWAYSDSLKIKAKQVAYKVVERQTKQLITIEVNKTKIITTPEHPFYINDKWVEAKDLKVRDSVRLFSGKKDIIYNITKKDTVCKVYNFAVENYHTYYVSNQNILVHNSDPCVAVKKRNATPGDKAMPSDRAARRESFRQHKVPTSKANNYKVKPDPDNKTFKKIETKDVNGKDVEIKQHPDGHHFKDNNTFEDPHYHGPKGGHITYPKKGG